MSVESEAIKERLDARDTDRTRRPDALDAWRRLQRQSEDIRKREDRADDQPTRPRGSPTLTDLTLVAFRDTEELPPAGTLKTETRRDGAIVARDDKGLIRSVDDGKKRVEYEYVTENGEVKRNGKGEPLVSKVTVTEGGKTQVFSADDLIKSGKNSLGQITAEGVTVEQSGDSAGKVKLLGKDGSSAQLGFATKPDGGIVARLDLITESNGSTHAFEYNKTSDPTFVTKVTDTVRTWDGQTQVTTSERVMESERWVRTEPDGNKHFIADLKVNDNGQLVYKNNEIIDQFLDKFLGESWLTSGDLASAREHFIKLASALGKDSWAKYVDGFIARCHRQGEMGVKQPTDDQIAATLRHLSSALEKRDTAFVKGTSFDDGMEKCLLSLWNPKKYNNQGQIGSCYLNTLLCMGTIAHPDRVAKAYASILTTGEYRGLKFTNMDVGPLAGQDRFNHAMTTLFGKCFGFKHMTPSFRGTTTSEAQKAYSTIFGEKFPVFYIGHRQSKAALDAAIKKYGAVAVITMGGGHAQMITKYKKDQYYLDNWWNGSHEGPISPSRIIRG